MGAVCLNISWPHCNHRHDWDTCMVLPRLSSHRWRWSAPWCSSWRGTTSQSSTAFATGAHAESPPVDPVVADVEDDNEDDYMQPNKFGPLKLLSRGLETLKRKWQKWNRWRNIYWEILYWEIWYLKNFYLKYIFGNFIFEIYIWKIYIWNIYISIIVFFFICLHFQMNLLNKKWREGAETGA